MFIRIQSFFTSVMILLGSILLLFRPAVPAPKDVDALLQQTAFTQSVPIADKVYVLEAGKIAGDQWHTAMCLQGLANREKAQFYISIPGIPRTYIEDAARDGVTLCYDDAEDNRWTLPTLIQELMPCIQDSGYVMYRHSDFAEGLNVATNYATIKGWLAIPTSLQEMAESCGLVLKKDISKDEYDQKFLTDFFNTYKDEFRKGAVIHVKSVGTGMRDFAIQQGFFVTYSDDTTQSKNYLRKVLKWSGEGTYILGWVEAEKHFVRFASQYGCSVIPADFARNNSFLCSYHCEIPEQTGKGAPVPADPTKHYAAIVFSDGDNVQWVQNGFTEYYRKIQKYDTFPMSWTFPLIQQEIGSDSNRLAYNDAGDKNSFIGGASGSGYMNPSFFKLSALDKFTTDTAVMMRKSNIDVLAILDDKPDAFHEKTFAKNFEYYARFDNIKGGIVMLDPDRYSSGHGRVWFSLGKPFVSVRLSLWFSESMGEAVTPEWLQEQADIVNHYAKDPTSVDGYSVININPWSVSVENMAYFVSLLDEDVELVTADQLIDLMAQNVKQK